MTPASAASDVARFDAQPFTAEDAALDAADDWGPAEDWSDWAQWSAEADDAAR